MKKIEIDKELKKILKTQTLLKFPDGCNFTGMTKKKGRQANSPWVRIWTLARWT